MNKTFAPVLVGAQIQGTGMRHPRVPKVYVGSELNGFVQGDLMDANAISQFITEKTKELSGSAVQLEEINRRLQSLESTDETTIQSIQEIVQDIQNLGTVETIAQDLSTIEAKLAALEIAVT